jgi:hypothetical protein
MCCGNSRSSRSRATSFQPAAPTATSVRSTSYVAYFEYTGRTALTIMGPSGARYRFAAPGARLSVDLRDRAALAAVPGLVQVPGL